MMTGEIKSYDLDCSRVFVFEHYLINQIKDDVHVNLEHVEVLRNLINENYGSRKMVYISNRVNTYSVDPLVYPEVARIKNLIGMAIVTTTTRKKKNAMFEKIFFQKDFQVFETFEESIIWAAGILSKIDFNE